MIVADGVAFSGALQAASTKIVARMSRIRFKVASLLLQRCRSGLSVDRPVLTLSREAVAVNLRRLPATLRIAIFYVDCMLEIVVILIL